MLILARCVGLLIVSGLLTCWDKIIGKLTRVEYLKTEQFLSELSVPLLMHSESQARDRGRKRPGRKATHCAMGFCKTLTLAHSNGKKPGVAWQERESRGRGFKIWDRGAVGVYTELI